MSFAYHLQTCGQYERTIQSLKDLLRTCDGRGPSSGPSSSPTTRSMEKRIQEDWDSATDGRETFLYMFKEDHKNLTSTFLQVIWLNQSLSIPFMHLQGTHSSIWALLDPSHPLLSPPFSNLQEEQPVMKWNPSTCVLDHLGSWDEILPFMEFSYNNSYNASIGMTPYDALYERKCKTPLCWH